MPHFNASQNRNNFVPLASLLPSRRIWPDFISTVRGDSLADSTARTGAGVVPASEHRGQRKGLAINDLNPLSSRTYLESLLAMGGLHRRAPWPRTVLENHQQHPVATLVHTPDHRFWHRLLELAAGGQGRCSQPPLLPCS